MQYLRQSWVCVVGVWLLVLAAVPCVAQVLPGGGQLQAATPTHRFSPTFPAGIAPGSLFPRFPLNDSPFPLGDGRANGALFCPTHFVDLERGLGLGTGVCQRPTLAVPPASTADAAPTLSLRLAIEGGRRFYENDQFELQIIYRRKVLRSVSSRGSGAAVAAGSTGGVRLLPGAWYSLGDRMVLGSPSQYLDYQTRMHCTNSNPAGTFVAHLTSVTNRIQLQAGDQVVCRIFKRPKSAYLTISKLTLGGVGVFEFESVRNADLLNTPGGYRVQTLHSERVVDGSRAQVVRSLTDIVIREEGQAGWSLADARCADMNARASGNPTGHIGRLEGNVLKIPGANVRPQADLVCTFTNRFTGWDISGTVILDTSPSQPHDGVQNGGESGQGGVRLRLTDCADHTYHEVRTGDDGRFSLHMAEFLPGHFVCVQEDLPPEFQSVSRHVGNTAAEADSESTRMRFSLQAGMPYTGLVFGNAPRSTLGGGELKMVLPGSRVRHTLRYVAGSSGALTLFSEVPAAGSLQHWAQDLYLDRQCVDPPHQVLERLPTAPMPVVAGQALCLVAELRSPESAPRAHLHRVRLGASLQLPVPTLTPQRQVDRVDALLTTGIAGPGLNVFQQQRKLQACPGDAAASMANPTVYSDLETVLPGEAIEYRLTYFNSSDTPLTHIELHDTVPTHTAYFKALCLHTPTRGIARCTVELQPQPGAQRGDIRWRLWDAPGTERGLQTADSGAASFCVYVQQ